MSPAFYELHTQIKTQWPHTVVCKGGRGSTKSSFMSVEFILFLLQHPQCHGVVLRKIANTLRNSVYAQLQWAIGALGLQNKFRCTVSPMEITYLPTGQKILFFGLDKPEKLKSIKLPFGYIGVDWFEEADQFAGEAEIRNVKQSTLRGGEFAMTFLSFNPPAAARNWANRYARETEPGKIVHHSTYLTTPRDWLGQRFFDDAEFLKETKPTSYRHEYLGEAVGNGTQVFDNIRLEPITKAQINSFGEITSGVDWGWYPDPWAFNRMSYDAARRTLYIFDELTRRKLNNFETARLVLSRIPEGEDVIADSAEKKSCADYRDCGIRCFEANKGPGSVNQSMKWLQDLQSVWFDGVRDYLRICDSLGQMYRYCDQSAWDVTEQLAITWGNGVLYDPDKEWQQECELVRMGYLRPEIALGHRYDMPCETEEDWKAIREKYMPDANAEPLNEVERLR